jgi:MFS transporter, DHA1 family, tetracycline resistance protein
MLPIYIAAIVVFCEGIVLWSVFPIMDQYCEALGGTRTMLGILFALMTIPKVVLNPSIGWLADRFGRKPLLIIAGLGSMTASLTWALAPALEWLAISRLIAGAFGAQALLAHTVIADVTTPLKRPQGMAVLGMAFALSMVLGPLHGGGIATLAEEVFGVGEAARFAAVGWSSAGVSLLGLVAIVGWLRETRPAHERESHRQAFSATGRLLIAPGVTLLLVVTLLGTIAQMQFTTTFGAFTAEFYAFTTMHKSWAFTVFGLIGAFVQGGLIRWLVPKYGARRIAVGGIMLMVGGLATLALTPPPPVFWAGLAALATGIALQTPTLAALLSRAVAPQRQGVLFGVQQGTMAFARGLGSGSAGALLGHFGPLALYGCAASLSLVGGVLLSRVSAAATPASPAGRAAAEQAAPLIDASAPTPGKVTP